jgi:hypothetical protein
MKKKHEILISDLLNEIFVQFFIRLKRKKIFEGKDQKNDIHSFDQGYSWQSTNV